jgi:LacI family transcriptional regulator
VNVHTREHVLAVVEELGYVPNPAARALESGRTRTIALLVPDITNPYFAGVIKGAERAAAAAGLTLVLGDTQESAATEEQLVRRLGRSVDGFVLSATRLPDDDLRRAAEAGPVVLVNRAARGLPCVVADYDSGTRQIVDHLASLAHESFVFAGGPAESWSGHRRWLGLQAAADAAGLEPHRFGPYSPTMSGGPAAADAVWHRVPRRWSATTTCWPSGSCDDSRSAERWCPVTSAWWASTTSWGPTSARHR